MTRFSNEQIAAALRDHPAEPVPAYVWHSGGGVMCVRVDIAPEGGNPNSNDPFILLTPREDWDEQPGVLVGLYRRWDDEGQYRFADDLPDAHGIVMEGANVLVPEAPLERSSNVQQRKWSDRERLPDIGAGPDIGASW